jgi:serine/threonine protein kinase
MFLDVDSACEGKYDPHPIFDESAFVDKIDLFRRLTLEDKSVKVEAMRVADLTRVVVSKHATLGVCVWGSVFRARFDGNDVAVKVMLKNDISMNEIRKLILLKNDACIGRLEGFYDSDQEVYCILELAMGSLDRYFDKNPDAPLWVKYKYSLDLVAAVMYLHGFGVHRFI